MEISKAFKEILNENQELFANTLKTIKCFSEITEEEPYFFP